MKKDLKLSNIIEKELQSAPQIEEFVLSGLANINAVAGVLRPLLISRLGLRISEAAISMAIRRYKLKYKRSVPLKRKFPSSIQIKTFDSLFEIAFAKNEKSSKALMSLTNKLNVAKNEILTIAQGEYEVVVLASSHYKKNILNVMKFGKITSKVDDIACVTVDWPASTKNIPGIYYRVTRALSRRNISIQSFHTFGSEMMILIKSQDLKQAHTSIKQLLSNSEFES